MANTISQKIQNYNYAPGIATYGIEGLTGESGADGNAIFYTNYDIRNANTTTISAIATQLATNMLLMSGVNNAAHRAYHVGDLFVDICGNLFKLISLEGLSTDIYNYFEYIGYIDTDDISKYLRIDNGRICLNTSTYKGLDIVSPGLTNDGTASVAAVYIASNEADKNNNINLVELNTVNNYNITKGEATLYYNTADKCFHIGTDNNIIINADVKVNADINSVKTDLDDYSTVLTSGDPIMTFKNICEHISYKYIKDEETELWKIRFIINPDADPNGLLKRIALNEPSQKKYWGNMIVKFYIENSIFMLPYSSFTRVSDIIYESYINEYLISANDTYDKPVEPSTLAVSLTYNVEVFLKKQI